MEKLWSDELDWLRIDDIRTSCSYHCHVFCKVKLLPLHCLLQSTEPRSRNKWYLRYHATSILLWVLLVGHRRPSPIDEPNLLCAFHLLATPLLFRTHSIRRAYLVKILWTTMGVLQEEDSHLDATHCLAY